MGVVNVTPDSFSDGGRWFGADAAIKHGLDAMTVLRDAILGTPWMPPIPMII